MEKNELSLSDLNPFVRYAQHQHTHWRSSEYFISEDCRLIYCFQNSMILSSEEENYTLSEDQMLFIPPLKKYRILPSEEPPGAYIGVCTFDLTSVNSRFDKPGYTFPVGKEEFRLTQVPLPPFERIVKVEQASFCKSEFKKVLRYFVLKEAYYREFSSVLIKNILLSILQAKNDLSKYSVPVQKAIDYIDLRFRDVRFPREIAAGVGYSPAHLSRLMKAETGKSLGDYLTFYRLYIAKKRLADHLEWTVGEVGERCGFASPSYFCVCFRREFGITPLEYRQQMLGN